MNLFFRLMVVFIRAKLSRHRISIIDEARLNYRVWLTDQDMFMHMTNSRYLSFSDLGTINYIVRTGSWAVLRKKNWFPVICAQSMIVTRMLTTPQKFTLVSKITGWTDTYVGLSHKFYHKGRVHAEVRVIARFASRDKTKVSPQAMIDEVGEVLTSPDLPEAYVSMIASIEQARQKSSTASRIST
ncbi:MAG: thioesterase family protein [Henriciella sp.]|nr:thioesterase family protein [Henriciella sp.]